MIVLGRKILFKALQPLNVPSYRVVTLLGSLIVASDSHDWNAPVFIAVTFSPIVTDFNDVQFMNEYCSIVVMPFGKTIDSRDMQLSKAYFPIEVTLSGIVIDFNELQLEKAYSPILKIPLGSSTFSK